MLTQVKDAQSIHPEEFPKPDYSFINDGTVKVSDPIWIPFDQILINIDGNRGRLESIPSSDRIIDLQNSFAPGIKVSEFLPAVTERNVDSSSSKPFELLYGIGRIWMFRDEMGCSGYWFNSIEGTEEDLEWVCANENQPLSKTDAKEKDVVKQVCRMIKNGDIPKDQKKIEEKIRKNLPFRKKVSRERIVRNVHEAADVPIMYVTYTGGTARRWILDHSKEEYVVGGKYDKERDMYGFLVKEGRIWNFFHRGIMIYYEHQKHSYGLMHYDLPSEGSTFMDKRIKQNSVINKMHDAYTKLGMDTRKFLHILGGMPQERHVDNWKVLVSLDFPPKKPFFQVADDVKINMEMPEILKKLEEELEIAA